MVEKIKNKLHGYHCDKCNQVPKVIFRDDKGFLCELHAIKEHGEEAVKNAVVEED